MSCHHLMDAWYWAAERGVDYNCSVQDTATGGHNYFLLIVIIVYFSSLRTRIKHVITERNQSKETRIRFSNIVQILL